MSGTCKESIRVAIIGCGFAGIGLAVRLKKEGFDTFTIFDKTDGPGGTWWDNTYPGAEVDVPSHLYSYSFKPYDWSRTHARQPELQRYLEEVVDDHDIRRHVRFKTEVVSAVWDGSRQLYVVTLGSGETEEFEAVVCALGFFSDPSIPQWPGVDDFSGTMFHTARWESQHDLAGKRIAVVGTGSTAVQVVPAMAEIAERVFVYQRQPGWINPKPERDFTPEERAKYRSAIRWRLRRWKISLIQESWQIGGLHAKPGSRRNKAMEAKARAYLEKEFADWPDLKALVTPAYTFAGKRIVQNSDFYPALKRDNVELVPHAVVRVTENGLVDTQGDEHEIDVLILATGFKTSTFLSTLEVVGREGQSIHDYWGEDAHALGGVTVPGFPNFFMLYGPNTNGGNILSNMQQQGKYVVANLKRLQRKELAAIEPKVRFESRYNQWLQKRLSKTTWATAKANNYYKSSSGRVVTQWPDGAYLYAIVMRGLIALIPFTTTSERRRTASRTSEPTMED